MYFGEQGPIPASNAAYCPGGWAFITNDVTHGGRTYCWPTYAQYQAAMQAMDRAAAEDVALFAPAAQSALPPVSTNAQGVQVGGTSIPWWAVVIGAILLLR